MTLDEVQWIHIEASSRCNAWCPSCPRNLNGHGLRPGLVEQDIQLDLVAQTLSLLPGLKTVQLCGNYGDPLAHSNIDSLIDMILEHGLALQIHTNGSLRNLEFWSALGKKFQLHNREHTVWFGIDGIGSVHEIYRQATDYDRIIANAKCFIDNGGRAVWQFILFEHNQHQIRDCMRLSQDLGFHQFKLVKTFRSGVTLGKHWRTGQSFSLAPASVYTPLNFVVKSGIVQPKDCMHLDTNSVYLSADGHFSPCCYFSSKRKYQSLADMLDIENLARELDTPHTVCLTNCGQ
jgi:sulfatase maturation enzyme AslB (radical SAM superfamily)